MNNYLLKESPWLRLDETNDWLTAVGQLTGGRRVNFTTEVKTEVFREGLRYQFRLVTDDRDYIKRWNEAGYGEGLVDFVVRRRSLREQC